MKIFAKTNLIIGLCELLCLESKYYVAFL